MYRCLGNNNVVLLLSMIRVITKDCRSVFHARGTQIYILYTTIKKTTISLESRYKFVYLLFPSCKYHGYRARR